MKHAAPAHATCVPVRSVRPLGACVCVCVLVYLFGCRQVCEQWWREERGGAEHLVAQTVPYLVARSLEEDARCVCWVSLSRLSVRWRGCLHYQRSLRPTNMTG